MNRSNCQTPGLAKPILIRAMLCVTAFTGCALSLSSVSLAAPDIASAALPVAAAHGDNTLPSGVVAFVNGVPIAQIQLDNALRASGQPDMPLFREAMKQNLIAREIFRQNAEKAHYDVKPEVLAAIAEFKVNAETQAFLKDNVHPEPVTDAQIKARYNEIVASLGQDDYKSRVIVVPDDASAHALLVQLKGGAAFDVLARQNSIDPTKVVGGEIGWVSFRSPATQDHTQGLPLAVAQALTQLPVGGVTPDPVVVDSARVIVKLDAKRPTQVPSFEQIKETVRKQLQTQALQQAMAAFVAAQTKAAKIQQ